MKKLFIGNISFSTSEDGLRSFFEDFGPLRSVRILTDRETGRSRGFGFIEIEDEAKADEAISAKNGRMLDGKALVVNEARPQEGGERGGRGESRGFGGGGGNSFGRSSYGDRPSRGRPSNSRF